MAEAGALRVERLSLAFGGLTVLNGVSLEVGPRELLALIGPNGAGKTSVLNCISGIYRPSAGRIFFGADELTHERPHRIARRGIGRTFQHGELFPHMTVVENLLVARHAHIATSLPAEGFFLPRVREAETASRKAVEEVLAFVDLERYRHHPVEALPFGVQKLVGFARALAMQPSVLLLDEPSAGLNRQEREDLARYLLRIRYELGVAMLWIEHDMQMVADLADRVCVLNYGEPLCEGRPDEVLANPRVIEAYLGSHPDLPP